MSELFQVGALTAFLQGVYESAVNFKTLAKKGNFGLGVMNALGGEMVALDGNFYKISSDGAAQIVSPDDCTPFALVSDFKEDFAFEINHVLDIASLNALLDSKLPTKNIFYMIRIDAELSWIKLRSEDCQTPPHQPLAEILPTIQHTFELAPSSGTLVGSYCPAYSAAITIPGFHYHYINKARKIGGHVFDLAITSARVMISSIREFHMLLPNTPEFDKALLNSNIDITSALKKIE
ncbi:MAG: acetolactate decarboxylase [Legionella sp.]|nr:acetolactate decarboxylase [Legionella sp.]